MFAVIGGIFWFGLFRASAWLTHHALQLRPVGELLVQRLVSLLLIVFFGLLVFSNVVTAFTTFFLDDELQFLFTKPIDRDELFTARFLDTVLHSSWIIFIFGLPLFIGIGYAVAAPSTYYWVLMGTLIPFLTIPTCIGSLIALAITNFLEAKNIRDVALIAGISALSALFLLIRSFRPERFLDPESFQSTGQILELLSSPASPYLPSTWVADLLNGALIGGGSSHLPAAAILVTTPLALYFAAMWVYRHWYHRGYTKAQEGRHGNSLIARFRDWVRAKVSGDRTSTQTRKKFLRHPRKMSAFRELARKDLATLLRDPGQWTQLFVVFALVVIYLVNYRYFAVVAGEELVGGLTLYLFNLIVCGFVIVALSGRFLFPAVSLEGRNFWLIEQGPISLETYLGAKAVGSALPVIVLGQLMIWSSNLLVSQPILVSVTGAFIVFILSVGIGAVGVSFGAIFPQFHNPNPTKIASSFGAVIFMIIAIGIVLLTTGLTLQLTLFMREVSSFADLADLPGLYYIMAGFGLAVPLFAGVSSIFLGAAALRYER